MILFLIVLAVVLYWVEKYSLVHGLDHVSFKTSLDKMLIEPDEPFTWTMTVKNDKWMMVPYLRVMELVPRGLRFAETDQEVEQKGIMGLRSVLYLAGRQKTELVRMVKLSERGRYFFRGSSVECGDFLGYQTSMENYPEMAEIVVKPRSYPHGEISLLLGGYLGDYAVRNSLFEDPVLTIGFREYTGREPFRSISWTQSARHNRLLVKQQEPVADLSCTVLLNTECSRGKYVSMLLEQTYSMVRSLCEELEKKKISYDFYTNGTIAGAMGNWKRVEEGLGVNHLETVLEGLGRMTYDVSEPLDTFFLRVLKGARGGNSFVVVTPERTARLDELVAGLSERTGRSVLVISAEEVMGDEEMRRVERENNKKERKLFDGLED
ncbi:MAG: DUF58 domain-containing protein [Lachnospiraceae bacterium]|nr:DUF58 domain-containing protein [Lachnospiraceae bacterium]